MKFEDFYSMMTGAIKYNKGKGNFEQLCRKIYTKYIYRAEESIEIFNSNFIEQINLAKTESDFDELEYLLEYSYEKELITESEYNYLLNLLKEKRNEIL